MKLYVLLEQFDPKRFVYELQQELLDIQPQFEVDVKKTSNDDKKDWHSDQAAYAVTTTVSDISYTVKLYYNPDKKLWHLYPWLSSKPVADNGAAAVYAAAIYEQLKQDLVAYCDIVTDEHSLPAERPFQLWLERECIKLFKYLFDGANRKLNSAKKTVKAVLLKDADEASLQKLQTDYNSTIVSTLKLKDGYEAFLLAKFSD